ncbi:MAG TPA: hypothetical protein VMW62_16845 [Chloroflexota bacterium]|nr:hypothetical protein [Chloroflexota bacterium]
MAISVVLSGAQNDDDVLRTSVCFAARERCELRVTLAPSFPRGTFLRRLDVALWRVAQLGLKAPQVTVERARGQAAEESVSSA